MNNFNITFELPELYPAITKSFLFGNAGDLARVTITFDSVAAPVAAARFRFGLIANSIDPYEGNAPSDFTIANDKLLSPYTGTIQAFSGNIGGGLLPALPEAFNTGTVTFTDLGGGSYQIQHDFRIPYLPEDTLLNGANVPDSRPIFNGSESPRYVFSVDIFDDLVNPTPLETSNDVDLSLVFLKGNCGYLNESLNTGNALYSVSSFGLTPSQYNPLSTTTGAATISTSGAPFTVGTKLSLVFGEIPSTLDNSTDLLTNYAFEKVDLFADGVPVSGTKIQNIEANISGANIELTFEMQEGFAQNYFIWVVVSNDAAIIQHANLWLTYGVPEADAPLDVVQFNKPLGADGNEDFRFFRWFEEDLANTYNHINAYRCDDVLAKWRIYSPYPLTEITSFKLRIFDTNNNATLEQFIVSYSQLPFLLGKNVIRADANEKKYITIDENGDYFDFSYGFQLWDNWIKAGIVLECTVQGNYQGNAFTHAWRSPEFGTGQFAITQNTLAEPQALPTGIEYFWVDGAGVIQDASDLGGVVAGQDTLVVATWQDDNLNDLQALESELRGYIGVNLDNGSQATFRAIYSTYDNEDFSPWKAVAGHTVDRAKVTKVDIKTATVSAILNWNNLYTIFGDALLTNKVCVTPRLDRFVPETSSTKTISFNFRGDDFRVIEYQLTEPITSGAVLEAFGDVPFGTLTFEYNTIPVWGGGTVYTYADWLVAIAGASAGHYIRISTSQSGLIDGGVLLSYIVPAAVPDPFTLVLARDKGIDKDVVIYFKNKVAFSSISATNSSDSYAAIRTLGASASDYTSFPFALTDTASLNAIVAGLSEGDSWGLHLHANITDQNETNTITVTGSYALMNYQIVDVAASYNNQKWRSINALNCKLYDSVLDLDVINGYTSPVYGERFYVYVAFYVTNASEPQKVIVGNRELGLGAGDRGHWEIACGLFGGQPDVRAFLSDNTTSGNDLVLVNRATYGYNVAQFVYDGGFLAAGCTLLSNGCVENVITIDKAAPFPISNSANRLFIGGRTNAANSSFADLFGGGIVKLQIVHYGGADPLPTAQQLRRDFMLGGIEASSLPAGASLQLDVDFNQTGTASPVDNGVNAYTITTLNGAAYAPFNSF